MMGRAACFDLARAQGVDKVGVFDIDEQLAKDVANKYGDGKATGAKLDAHGELVGLVEGERVRLGGRERPAALLSVPRAPVHRPRNLAGVGAGGSPHRPAPLSLGQ